jgi:type IV pilus assembly protein PilN
MYPININLLNDRPGYSAGPVSSKGTLSGADNTPLIWGGAFAGGLLALTLLAFGGFSLLSQQLVSQEQKLDADLTALAPGLSKVSELKAQEQVIQSETAALAKVFNQIKPWSATLQDLRDRVPATLQITKIEQTAAAAPPPASGSAQTNSLANKALESSGDKAKSDAAAPAPPPPAGELKISGNTLNYSDVNDFELTLRKSAFLKPDRTKLTSSQRENNAQTGINLIKYEMQTQLSDVPASEVLQVLNAKGATGLVSRIETLKRQGAMKP